MNNEIQSTETHVDILSDTDIGFEYATTGQRFLNFLIDNILMRVGVSYLTSMLVGVIIAAIYSDGYYVGTGLNAVLVLSVTLLFIFNYIFYYTICEKFFNGVTLGKLITGTKAVRTDGTALTLKDALLRSLSRIVPFEALSGFGTPWHDSWTNTTVIKTR